MFHRNVRTRATAAPTGTGLACKRTVALDPDRLAANLAFVDAVSRLRSEMLNHRVKLGRPAALVTNRWFLSVAHKSPTSERGLSSCCATRLPPRSGPKHTSLRRPRAAVFGQLAFGTILVHDDPMTTSSHDPARDIATPRCTTCDAPMRLVRLDWLGGSDGKQESRFYQCPVCKAEVVNPLTLPPS